MSAVLILCTSDARLAADWRAQLPYPDAEFAGVEALRRELAQPGARVLVRDVADPRGALAVHPDAVVVVVGQPQSLPFEQARLAGLGRFFLSYDESRTALLGETVRTAAELAEKNAVIATLQARRARPSAPSARAEEPASPRALDELAFIDAAIEHLEDRDRVLDEFRRAARAHLQAARVALFLRDGEAFRSDRFGWSCPAGSPLARCLEALPCLIDLDHWNDAVDAATESHVRQQMQAWGARLLVPLHDAGRLAGWAAYGPRADGRPYGAGDQARALELGRLLERCLEKSSRLQTLARVARADELRRRYLPCARLLGPDAASDQSVPPEIRALAGEVLRSGRVARLEPGPTVRFRAEAGPVPETGGVWVHWIEAAPELSTRAAAVERERLKLCRELGLTLAHELGSPLVTFSTFLQLAQQPGSPPDLAQEFGPQFERDVERMRSLGQVFRLMQEFMAGATTRVDLGDLCRGLDLKGVVRVASSEMAPVIHGNEPMLRFALQTVVDGLVRQRPEGDAGITLAVKRRGEGDGETGLVVFSGRDLRLEGFLEPAAGGAPVHPLLAVFLAREIFHWHHGTLQGGQGIAGGEVQIALRSRPQAGPGPATPAVRFASAAPFATGLDSRPVS